MDFRDKRPNRQGVADQVRTLIRCARELGEDLDRATFNRRPPAGGWSVAECIDHLNATARLYLPVVTDAIDDARARAWSDRQRDGRTWTGRLLVWSQEPPARFRVRTVDALEPGSDLDPAAVLDEFEALHEELIVRINESRSLDLRRIRIRSLLKSWLKLSLEDWFAFLAAHGRRHLWQAEQALDALREDVDVGPGQDDGARGRPRGSA